MRELCYVYNTPLPRALQMAAKIEVFDWSFDENKFVPTPLDDCHPLLIELVRMMRNSKITTDEFERLVNRQDAAGY